MNFSLPAPITASRGSVVATPGSGRRSLVAEIYVYIGQELHAKYAIEHGEYIIGRDDGCNINIPADRVSRHHARLIFNAYEVVLEDLESSNGVFIDGVQLQLPTRVYPEQEVQIGAARLFIHLDADSTKELRDSLWDTDLGLAPVRQQLEGARYKVLTTLARGGMGVVLQARDLRVRRTVAMKVMKSGAQFSKENVLRFIDEAQLTGQLDHPNIVPVYELGIDDRGEAFYTMKYVKGTTLDEVLRGLRNGRKDVAEKYPLATLLTVFQKICDAVAFAHAKGVIHRDLKPENVMIGAYGEVLVMDWGLAKQTTGPNRTAAPAEAAVESKPRHPMRAFETMHGVVVGTPPFVSPEQARGDTDAVDTRSDVYVLGAILYAILTLRAPVEGLAMEDTLYRIIEGDLPKPSSYNQAGPVKKKKKVEEPAPEQIGLLHCPGQRIPESLSAIVMKAMATTQDDRYQSVVELQADLTSHQGGFATKAERAGVFRQALLFGARHKRELAIFFGFAILVQALLVAFIIELSREKNHALANEKHAKDSETRALASEARALASEALARSNRERMTESMVKLQGAAPSFAAQAEAMINTQHLEEALEEINNAVEQVPNKVDYLHTRANILQALLRLDDSTEAYEDVLTREPGRPGVKLNLDLNKKLAAQIGEDGKVPQTTLRELHKSLLAQQRVGEALAVYDLTNHDRQLFVSTWKATLEKRGVKPRFQTLEDETLSLDLSRQGIPDLRQLRGTPLSVLNLDDTRTLDISALQGLPLTQLSLNHTLVRDLTSLIGMPLHSLDLEGTPVGNLQPLSQLPLQVLRMAGTKIESLSPLKALHLEHLNVAGCRNLKDVSALAGMPLQRVDLSRTNITDLHPLVQPQLRELDLEGCVELVDLTPLMEMKGLETVRIPGQCRDIAFLRDHPSLKRLSYKKMTQPIDTFWEEWDAKTVK